MSYFQKLNNPRAGLCQKVKLYLLHSFETHLKFNHTILCERFSVRKGKRSLSTATGPQAAVLSSPRREVLIFF